MKIRLAGLLTALGGELVFAPLLLKEFEGTSDWPNWWFYGAGALCLILSSSLHRDEMVKSHFALVVKEVASFYSHYPWRPVASAVLVCFLILILVADAWINISAPQVAALGLAIWGVPYLVGEAVFAGRRR